MTGTSMARLLLATLVLSMALCGIVPTALADEAVTIQAAQDDGGLDALGGPAEIDDDGIEVQGASGLEVQASTTTVSYNRATVSSDGSVTYETVKGQECVRLTDGSVSWGTAGSETWYVVDDNVAVTTRRVECLGTVNLVLALTKGKTLKVTKGIEVAEGASLNIYMGDSPTAGSLIAGGSTSTSEAGIGGGSNCSCGTVTVHGGEVTATGGGHAAGIGGGWNGSGGDVTVYGGVVTAVGGDCGAGIGGCRSGNGGTVTVYGGTVVTSGGGNNAQGIGCYRGGSEPGALYIGKGLFLYGSRSKIGADVSSSGCLLCEGAAQYTGNRTRYMVVNGVEPQGVGEESTAMLSYAKAKVTRKVGCKAFTNRLTNEYGVTVTYKSSNAKVAKVNKKTGRVTVKAAGTATITASFAGDKNYGAASASYKLVVGLSKATGVKTVCHPGDRTIDVSWNKVAGAKRYQVQWRVAGGTWRTAKTGKLAYTIGNLVRGACCQVRVRAVSGKTRGAWSKASRRWYVPTTCVRAKSASTGRVTVRWSSTEGASKGYAIYVYDARTGKVLATRKVGAKRTTATIKGLKSSKKIRVAVRPLRSAGGYTYLGVLTSTANLKVA